jgi:hypothetical protein
MSWYDKETEWSENHDYANPEVTTPLLRSWYLDMIVEFPSIDDPAHMEEDNPRLSEYNFGSSIIYIAFAWSQATNAREAVFRLAKKHKVGFFDVSAEDGGVWLPDANGEYRCIHGDCLDEEAA